jgi:hypothetical protein
MSIQTNSAEGDIAFGVPPGVVRSQQAFWRDLPDLLSQRKLRGCWVLYHGDQRIGIARDAGKLLQECERRQLRGDDCYLAAIAPHSVAPWEVEDIGVPDHAFGTAEFQAAAMPTPIEER